MTSQALLMIAILSVFGPGQAEYSPRAERHTIGGWHYTIVEERFSHQVHCQLFMHGAEYADHILTLHFGSSVDTSFAWYSKDGGPAAPWQRQIPALLVLGARLDTDSLQNPSGGRVLLPQSEITGVDILQVAPNVRVRPRSYNLAGLNMAIRILEDRGCWGRDTALQ